jgi:uncharacterized protein (TIGR02391 family)
MQRAIEHFESIVRRTFQFTDQSTDSRGNHPLDIRVVHPDVQNVSRKLFDDGHYPQATFEAFKFLDEEVQRISGESEYGTALMEKVFGGTSAILKLNPGVTLSERNEQSGYKMLFAGGMLGIRNPRGHKVGLTDTPDQCLDHLSFASMLLRRLEQAGLRNNPATSSLPNQRP